MVIRADALEIKLGEISTQDPSRRECRTHVVDGRFDNAEAIRHGRIRSLLPLRDDGDRSAESNSYSARNQYDGER